MVTIKDEWIVEQAYKAENGKTLMRVIGKIIFNEPKEELTEDDAEAIWDLCNYAEAQYEPSAFNSARMRFENDLEVYNGLPYYHVAGAEVRLIPMHGAKGYVNDDIFIRRHYNTEEGWWIDNDHRRSRDKWVKESRAAFINYHRY